MSRLKGAASKIGWAKEHLDHLEREMGDTSHGSCPSMKTAVFRYSQALPVSRWPDTRERPTPFAPRTLLRFNTTMGQSEPDMVHWYFRPHGFSRLCLFP